MRVRIGTQPGDYHAPDRRVGLAIPATSSRTRVTLPEEAWIGATQQRCGQAASERIRPGLSPAVTRSVAAVSAPTPWLSSNCGVVFSTSSTIRMFRRSRSASRTSTL